MVTLPDQRLSIIDKLGKVVLLAVLVVACNGPNEKKMKFFSCGKACYEKGALLQAGLEFTNAVQIDPEFADAHFMLGMVELKRGNPAAAFGCFTRAIAINPGHLGAQTQLGRLYLAKGEPLKALAATELVLREDRRNEEASLVRGAAFLALGENGKARAHFERSLRDGIAGADVFFLLASAHLADEDARGAEEVLLRGEKVHPNSVQLNRALASLLFESERSDQAAVRVERVIALEPANFSNRVTLAGLYWDIGREQQARVVLGKLMEVTPDREACRLDIADFFLSREARRC